MSPWWVFIVMATGAIFFLTRPFFRTQRTALARANYDLEVYRAQLKELKSDNLRGLISDPEYKAALIEIERRVVPTLLTKDRAEQKRPPADAEPQLRCAILDAQRGRIRVGTREFEPELDVHVAARCERMREHRASTSLRPPRGASGHSARRIGQYSGRVPG